MLVNFQCWGVLLIWIMVGQRPTALAGGVGGVVWTFFLSLAFLTSFSLFLSLSVSLGDGPILTEMLPQRAFKPQTNHQPTSKISVLLLNE